MALDTDELVGSAAARIAAVVLAAAAIALWTVYVRDLAHDWPNASFWLALVSSLLAFMSLVHTSRALFARWMRVADTLHTVVISILFGAVYLLIVPVFALVMWPFDLLRVRKRPAETYWITKRRITDPAAELQRMG